MSARSEVSIKRLRAELPGWEWTAERHGMGWRYVGCKAYARVTVQAFGVLCGPSEDDFAVQWRVTEGDHSEPFSAFWLRWSAQEGSAR